MSASERGPGESLVLLTRSECGLCEEMQRELAALGRQHSLPPLRVLDVDSDPQLQRRYGLKIPVLLFRDVPVCSARLDAAELLRVVGRQRAGS